MTSKNKYRKQIQSIYLTADMLQEIKEEAIRLDRSISWVIQRAWKLAHLDVSRTYTLNNDEYEKDED